MHMTGLSLRSFLCLAAGVSLMTALPLSALALTPTTNAEVTSAAFTTITHRNDIDSLGTTAYMGIDECIDAVNGGEDIVVQFNTVSNLGLVDASGVVPFIGGFYFEVERDSATSVTCSSDTTVCSVLETDTDVTVNETNVIATVDFSRLTGITSEDECLSGELDKEYFIRINFQTDSTLSTVSHADVRVILDTQRPNPPDSFEAVLTESASQITWVDDSPSSDVSGYVMYTSDVPITGNVLAEDLENLRRVGIILDNNNNSGTIDADLIPNSSLYVTIATEDEAGNMSEVLESQAVTVLDTVDFWEGYKTSGGTEEGGCSSTPAQPFHLSWMILVGMLGLLPRGVRRLQSKL